MKKGMDKYPKKRKRKSSKIVKSLPIISILLIIASTIIVSTLFKEDFKKIVEVYQTDETKKALEEQYGGQSIPVW